MKKTAVLSFLSSLVLPFAAYAQQQEAFQPTAALPFIQYEKNPVSAAIGGAGIASPNSPAWASFGNVAAVPFAKVRGDVSLSYLRWQPDKTNYINLGAAFNLKQRLGIAVGASIGPSAAVEQIGEGGKITGKFSPMDFQLNLGVSYRFIDCLSLGVNGRFSSSRLTPDYTLTSFMADVFLMAKFGNVCVAAGARNLGSKAGYGSGIDTKYPIPSLATLGASFSPRLADKHALELCADFRYGFWSRSAGVGASVGAAYIFNDMLSIRAGYCLGGELIANHASVGLGFKVKGFHIDAAYFIAGQSSGLRNSFNLGLGVSF